MEQDKQFLKDQFEDSSKLKGKPSKYIDKLEELKDRLKHEHNVEKAEEDIIDQVLRVASWHKSPYENIVDQLKLKRDEGSLHIDTVKKCLNRKYKEFTKKRRSRRNRKKYSSDS